jgi:hypothetical protein
MSGHSVEPTPTTPAPTDGQISLHDEIMPYDEAAPDDDNTAPDTTDDESDTSDSSNSSDTEYDSDSPNPIDDLGDDTNAGNDEEHSHLLTEPEVAQPQEELWVEPTIAHYPGKRAGEVCSKGITVMQGYKNALGGPSDNPYFPFSSQIDWELAKWAKLRGPSATSFTELLHINGVSAISELHHLVISLPLSSCTKS